ncbi:MAG: LPS export ABC transporter permease LptG [Proteobacteria bacterium]|nr:LPS export ABC transporter permease LptG [Pseudomonadota bacterium]
MNTSTGVMDMRDGMDLPKGRPQRGYSPTLGWYLASRWFVTLVVTLLALALFVYLVNTGEVLRDTTSHGAPALQAVVMSLAQLPDLMMQLLPFAVLLASLIWVQQMNRRQELVALRASGLPARRIVLGPVSACLLVGVAALFVMNPISATLLKFFENWRSEVMPNSVKGIVTSGGSIWLRQDEMDNGKVRTFFIYGRSVAANGQSLGEATVFVFDEKGDFMARLDATQAKLEDGYWRMEDTYMLSPQKKIVHEAAVTLPTTLTAEQIQSSFNPPGTLNLWELRNFISVLQQSGLPAERHAMVYQRLLALPFTCLAMLLLAVPFGLRFARGRGVASVVLAGLGLGFGFYLLGNFAAAYGMAGRLNVILAAWLPGVMALLLSAALLIHLREE